MGRSHRIPRQYNLFFPCLKLAAVIDITHDTYQKRLKENMLSKPSKKDLIPPKYFDSEPSSQPPRYPDNSKATTSPCNLSSMSPTAGVSAACVHAVLAEAPNEGETKFTGKKSWGRRWQEYKERIRTDWKTRRVSTSSNKWTLSKGMSV
ncbi:hypothetical protein K491DRAFT_722166 [Lophiostoma macrostomum CBS 122681]|uniref:Uncharacterized protein n=1 Tax=Lophiostoma macrostomum CBS 122681 TaxID=1314788 RepID=A0A6A6SRT6_9PLEO|nr:hypothetical protein K491DRAFT_722166 [Lophiostoma macrostomum CBS 122681]